MFQALATFWRLNCLLHGRNDCQQSCCYSLAVRQNINKTLILTSLFGDSCLLSHYVMTLVLLEKERTRSKGGNFVATLVRRVQKRWYLDKWVRFMASQLNQVWKPESQLTRISSTLLLAVLMHHKGGKGRDISDVLYPSGPQFLQLGGQARVLRERFYMSGRREWATPFAQVAVITDVSSLPFSSFAYLPLTWPGSKWATAQ